MGKKKKKKDEENVMSEAQLEFNNLWISYDVLHDRLDNKVNRDRLSGDGKLLMVFFILWTLFMASYDYSTGWRATSDLAVLESLVHPRFPSSQSSSFKTAAATAQSRKSGSTSNNSFSSSLPGLSNKPKMDQPSTTSASTPKFISFHDIQSIEDYNTWLEDVFLEEIYVPPVYDAITKREKSIQLQDQQSILWGVAIRQHRVAPVIGGGGNSGGNLATGGSGSGCCVPKEMQDQIQCHPSYGHFGDVNQYNSPIVTNTKGFGQWYYDEKCVEEKEIALAAEAAAAAVAATTAATNNTTNTTNSSATTTASSSSPTNTTDSATTAAGVDGEPLSKWKECVHYQWNYQDEKIISDSVYTADYLSTGVDSSYDGGGYRVIIPRNVIKAKEKVYELLGQQSPCRNRTTTPTTTTITAVSPNSTAKSLSFEEQEICNGTLSPFIDVDTRMVVVTIQTYTVNTNVALKANLIVEFASTGKVGTVVHFHTDSTMLDSILPQPAEAWHVFAEFCMIMMGIVLFMRSITTLVQKQCKGSSYTSADDTDEDIERKKQNYLTSPSSNSNSTDGIYEWLNLVCFSCVVIFFLVSAYDRIIATQAGILRQHMRISNETGYYTINFADTRAKEQILLVASILLVLQVFRYLKFFRQLSLINGACDSLTWALMCVVLIVLILLIVFAFSGMYMFAITASNFSSFTLAFISLCRAFFGSFDFDEAYQGSFTNTFLFVTTFNWITIVVMTVLSSAILIDGVRMQSEFETLQRRGLPAPKGTDYSKIIKKTSSDIVRVIFYKYGCLKSPLMQDFLHYWCDCRKWVIYCKNVRCCSWCRVAKGGGDMSYAEAYDRLKEWKKETENKDKMFIDFKDVKIAMLGTNRNRRIVDDHEVGNILTLCYIDPVLKGESYFQSTEDKNIIEQAKKDGKPVYIPKSNEYSRSLQSLKEIFHGVQLMTSKNHSQILTYSQNMTNINDIIKLNEQKLEGVRMRFKSLKGKRE